MSNHPLDLTVIVPTYDRPVMLDAALRSVLAQTRSVAQVIVVDNGANPDTTAVAARYPDMVRYVRQAPQGVQVARNTGIEAARTRWISFLDDDDLYSDTLAERCAPILEEGRADIVCVDHRKFSATDEEPFTNFDRAPAGFWDGVPRPSGPGSWTYMGRFPIERLLRFIPFYPSQMIMERRLALAVGGFDPAVRGIVAEDVDFLVRVLSAGRLAILWESLVRYRLHGGNDSRGWNEQAWGRWTIFNGLCAKPGQVDPAFISAMTEALPGMRARAFDAAFGTGRLTEMQALAHQLAPVDRTVKRRLKLALARLPEPIRHLLVPRRDVSSWPR